MSAVSAALCPSLPQLFEQLHHVLRQRGGYFDALAAHRMVKGGEVGMQRLPADQRKTVRELIRPTVASGRVLLCDRYVDSSVAYQGGGRQLGVQRVLDINAMAVDGALPLATVYLDINHEAALKRRHAATSPDRIEAESDAFFARVEQAYRELIRRDPERFIVVDASQPPEVMGEEIAQRVIQRLVEDELHASSAC